MAAKKKGFFGVVRASRRVRVAAWCAVAVRRFPPDRTNRMPQGVVRGGPVWGVAHAHRYARIREASCAVLGAVRGAGSVGLGGEGAA